MTLRAIPFLVSNLHYTKMSLSFKHSSNLVQKWPIQNKEGFSSGSDGKESACNMGDLQYGRFDLWVKKVPWRRKWTPT